MANTIFPMSFMELDPREGEAEGAFCKKIAGGDGKYIPIGTYKGRTILAKGVCTILIVPGDGEEAI